MSSVPPDSDKLMPTATERRRIQWDAVAAIIASLIGFLALLVAGYTAYIEHYIAEIQTKQVQAQVWPWLVAGNNDNEDSIEVINKGVGPAIVKSAQVFVDGKPQPDWQHVLTALGTVPHRYSQMTLNPNVLAPGEKVTAIQFADKDDYARFRAAAVTHLTLIDICYCSTLGECWRYSDQHLVGYKSLAQLVKPVAQCPKLAKDTIFVN
ncbi:MAG TPA: hypothetical protein VFY97_04145 [Rhodanobacteraceae bacterium]|nr:hypothetical protein [Rhodanobacteraceae bacterium]